MQTRFEFVPYYSEQFEVPALDTARLLCNLQRLYILALALSHDEVTSYAADVFDGKAFSYEKMITADQYRGIFAPLKIVSIKFQSPLVIETAKEAPSIFRHLKPILEIFRKLILIDVIRQEMVLKNEKTRQEIIGETLKNYEHVLKIAGRIKDPARRRAFEANLGNTIADFIIPSAYIMKKMDILELQKIPEEVSTP